MCAANSGLRRKMGRSRGLKFKNRPKIETSRPKLSTPRPRASIFSGFKVGSANWARRASKFVVAFLKNGPVAAKLKSRPRDRPKMSAVSSKSALWAESETSEGPKMQKLSTPPPSDEGICRVRNRGGKMEPRRPLIQPFWGSAIRKSGHFEPKIGPK